MVNDKLKENFKYQINRPKHRKSIMEYISDGYITEEFPRVGQPKQVSLQLKPHQLTAIRACLDMETTGYFTNNVNKTQIKSNVGIICDPVGAGKSLTCLSLAANNEPVQFHDSCIYSSPGYFEVIKEAKVNIKVVPITVIIVPHGVYNQWDKYVKDQTTFSMLSINNIRTMIKVGGTAFNQKDITDVFKDILNNKYQIVLLSAMQYPNFLRCFRTICGIRNSYVRRCIIDEVDTIRTNMSDRLPSQFTWFVSSSVNNLINPNGGSHRIEFFNEKTNSMDSRYERVAGIRTSGFAKEFFTQLTANPPEMFWPLFIKNKKAFIDSSLNLPKFIRHIIKCGTPGMINVLEGLVSNDVIQRLSAGDVEGALETYSGETSTESNIIKLVAGTLMANIRNLQIDYDAAEKKMYGSEQSKKNILVSIEKRINEIRAKIQCIEERVIENDMCNICYNEPENKVVTKCCQNIFCFQCIGTWFGDYHNTCPMCNNPMTEEDFILLRDDAPSPVELEIEKREEDEQFVFNESDDKPANLKVLLQKRNSENKKAGRKAKYLIFSSYDASFHNIKETLEALDMNCEQVKGSSAQVSSVVERYKEQDLDMLLLNARHFGAGLNLENTTDLIFYHGMDKDLEYQVVGRAQRPGRTCPLNIWHLCYDSEEKNANQIDERF